MAFLIAGSRGASFYAQIAVLAHALRTLRWQRWTPSIHAWLGGPRTSLDDCEYKRWERHLRNVVVTFLDGEAPGDNWPQVDATFEQAPRDADVLVSLDADTLPVSGFEEILDRVAEANLIAGVIAHFAPPGLPTAGDWVAACAGLLRAPLAFDHWYSLMRADAPAERRRAPFYVNGGVVFYARRAFDAFSPAYLSKRDGLMKRLPEPAFSGQIATTLAVADVGVETWALPVRYNFPNDPLADEIHPHESDHIVIHHYLRTNCFDRHQVFLTEDAYRRFLDAPMDTVNARVQGAVRGVLGDQFPFR